LNLEKSIVASTTPSTGVRFASKNGVPFVTCSLTGSV
jgi:hypothetical protein